VAPSIGFRRLSVADPPLLHRWLNLPHVADTYGLGRRPTLGDVAEEYGPLATGEDRTRAFVVEADGRPVGYVQTYRILEHPVWAAQCAVEDESHGIDLFLGEPDTVGRGLGPVVIRAFVEREVFARTDAVAVVADPRSENRRSISAFEKAGFRRWRSIVPVSPEMGDVLLRLDRPAGG
jgi:aminoglycoside 6'-N-acetyltransferase